jgi:3-deoxy-D-manno-octulosonic acid kinase
MIESKRQQTDDGAILFDTAVLAPANADGFDAAWFDVAHWRRQQRATDVRGGRGSVSFVDAPFGASVLRHYRRGGLIARALNDVYFWSGENRTRAFAEFRLLAALRDANLPVPAPVAARYERNGLIYRADLLTRRIDNAVTFAESLQTGKADGDIAQRIGDTLARFHAAGACHADLNAHNILITADEIWLVDFDRGILRTPEATWRRANVARLHRSCMKVLRANKGAPAKADEFEKNIWTPLLRAYEQRFELLIRAPLRSVRT